MAQCDVQAILSASSSFAGLPTPQLEIVKTALLCELLMQANPMATCNVNDLLQAGRCFANRLPGEIPIIQTQLLCEILNAGGGGGATCLLCGVGPPTIAPPCPCSLYYSLPPNSGLWSGDSTTGLWDEIIAPGP